MTTDTDSAPADPVSTIAGILSDAGRGTLGDPRCLVIAEKIAAVRVHPAVQGQPVTITYRNWRGVVSKRTVKPLRIFWGANAWHPEPQWLIEALDTVKGDVRTFALAGIGTHEYARLPAEMRGLVERLGEHFDLLRTSTGIRGWMHDLPRAADTITALSAELERLKGLDGAVYRAVEIAGLRKRAEEAEAALAEAQAALRDALQLADHPMLTAWVSKHRPAVTAALTIKAAQEAGNGK